MTGTGAGEKSNFDTSTFLSLAKQPGAKTAALQYLMSSTRNALGTIGESQETSAGRSPSSQTPATSPSRSASVGSLGCVGSVGGVGGIAAPPPASSLMHNVSHEGHRHAVPASVYSGTAGTARAPYRPISSSGPGSSMQGIDAGRDRLRDMLGVPRSGTGPGTSPAS